jgi:precorrin-6x reductase
MENLMPRFYFNLVSKNTHIPDDNGKELATLNDACEHAQKLIHKILFHVGHEEAEEWEVIVLNDDHDAQMIVPFSVSHALRAQRRATGRESSNT